MTYLHLRFNVLLQLNPEPVRDKTVDTALCHTTRSTYDARRWHNIILIIHNAEYDTQVWHL